MRDKDDGVATFIGQLVSARIVVTWNILIGQSADGDAVAAGEKDASG